MPSNPIYGNIVIFMSGAFTVITVLVVLVQMLRQMDPTELPEEKETYDVPTT